MRKVYHLSVISRSKMVTTSHNCMDAASSSYRIASKNHCRLKMHEKSKERVRTLPEVKVHKRHGCTWTLDNHDKGYMEFTPLPSQAQYNA